jgi:hypothetical protein
MLAKFIAIFLLMSSFAYGADAPCPQIDQSVKDVDGMPFCPSVVTETSAYGVFRCSLEAARKWHVYTKGEKGAMQQLLQAWKANRSGITVANTASLLTAADNLNLQACRVKAKDDSYVLVYTKPKVSTYSGPFMMLRETKASKFVIISPHDDSDGTFADTKKAFANSSSLAMVSNGHKRGNVTAETCGNERQQGDMVHQPQGCNLGTETIFMLTAMFNGDGEMGTIMLHIHGMKNPDHVLYRDRDNKALSKAYEAAVVKATNIKPDAFSALNADFSVDSVKGWMLKTEQPSRIHQGGDMMALTRIVKNLETNSFAWGDK